MSRVLPRSPQGDTPSSPAAARPGPGARWCFGSTLCAVLIAVLSTFLVARISSVLTVPEFAVLDYLIASRPPRTPDARIALVGVSKADVDIYENKRSKPPEPGEPDLRTCACATLPRDQIGELITKVKQHGARVVVLDLSLQQACPIRGHDRKLAYAMDKVPGGETILAEVATPTPDQPHFTDPPAVFLGPESAPRLLASPVLFNPHGTVRGVRLIQSGSTAREKEIEEQGMHPEGELFPPLALAAYVAFRGDPCEIPLAGGDGTVTCCDDTSVPVWSDGRIYLMEPFMPRPDYSKHIMLINWTGPAGTIPILDQGAVRSEKEANKLDKWFQGKIVIIGSDTDRQTTPMAHTARKAGAGAGTEAGEDAALSGMSGIEVHGQALDTLLQHRFLRPLPTSAIWALLLGSCLLTALAFSRLPVLWGIGVAIILPVILLQMERVLLRSDLWVYSVIPTVGLVLSGVATGLWGYTRSRHEAAELAEVVEEHQSRTVTLVHDLKQPLSAISGLAAAIRATQQGDNANMTSPELVMRIQRQVERALADIDDLLINTAGREVALVPQRFDLAALARDLGTAQSLKSTVHNVEVRTSAPEIWMVADPRYLGRALSNLVDNAIKYWPEGGTVVVEVIDGPGQAQVRVTDGGLGMSPEQQTRIFERFRRAVPEHVGIPGTGVGLYSVKRVADAHGGTIAVQSKAGAGSTFILTIPHHAVIQSEEGDSK